MKFARINVKCSSGILKEVDSILPMFADPSQNYIHDFFEEVSKGASAVLQSASDRNILSPAVSSEFFIYCPYSVYLEAPAILEKFPKKYSDLYMLLEYIVQLKEDDFFA